MSMLVAAGCSARYDADAIPGARRTPGAPVFEDIGLRVDSGELLTVVGRSGSGKSTLLLVLAGLKEPSTGEVTIDGIAISRGDPRVGLVLQHFGLLPWYTVIENVTLGMRIRRAGSDPDRTGRARAMLDRIGLSGKEHRYPRELSGGEQQRVALARTLVLEPEVLLLDEPFSALDALTREELQEQLLTLLDGTQTAGVMVTHSIDEAVYLGGRVGILSGAAPTAAAASAAPAQSVPRPSRLLLVDNPAPPSAGEADAGRRTDPSYLNACATVRDRFREAFHA
jgi:ABC-type nitrate/sulfonate/bicarbonate transport system ATPase subunit